MLEQLVGFAKQLTVTELTEYISELFQIDPLLRDVQVQGEISNFTRASSGHLYFTLKDSGAQLKCAMWRSQADRLRFRPEAGDGVELRGRIGIYPTSGVYQMYVQEMNLAGQGDLAQAFEQLKEKLLAEGIFDGVHKQRLPELPRKIGIVSSVNAAALRDIIDVIRRRYPMVSLLLAPTLVQGDGAPKQIVQAIERLGARDDLDLIIVARGGGSIEDLWAFNDEQVVRAIHACPYPVVTGVGHETDITLVDFVADQRAPTPSAAAELAVPDQVELLGFIKQLEGRMERQWEKKKQEFEWGWQRLQQRLDHLSPERLIEQKEVEVGRLVDRLGQGWTDNYRQHQEKMMVLEGRLIGLNPIRQLERGYVIVRQEDGESVRFKKDLVVGQKLSIQFQDGTIEVEVQDE